MQKTMEKEDTRLHRAYSSRWKRGHRRAIAEMHFEIEARTRELMKNIDKRGAPVTGFEEDHSLPSRSWALGSHTSIPKTDGVEGRNFVD